MAEHADDEIMLNFGDNSELLMTRHNGTLYTFIGNLSTRNHVFVEHEQTDGVATGSYIFAHSNVFERLVGFMFEHDYPMNINHNVVMDCDEDAFEQSLEQLTGSVEEDYIPDDFYK